MKEEIIEICKRIKNLSQCNTCGGEHKNGICIFCGNENQEIIYLSSRLEKKLQELPLNLFEPGKLDYTLTTLYEIRNLEIPMVSNIIQETNYEKTILETYAYIQKNSLEITKNSELLSSEQYHFLLTSYLNDEFVGNLQLEIGNVIVKAILENSKRLNIDSIDKEKLFLKFTELAATNILGLKSAHAKIKDEASKDEDNAFGSACFNNIVLSRKMIHESPKDILPTIFHELIHLKQYKEQKIDRVLSFKNLIQIKDGITKEIIPSYYQENYKNISYEKEAFYYQYKETIDYLSSINVEASPDMIEKAVYYDRLGSDFLTNTKRLINGNVTSVDDIFDELIINNPKYLEEYPQLMFEYKIDNNLVRRKNLVEIHNDYDDFRNGNIKLNGNQYEINQMYIQKIEAFNININNEQSKSSSL